MSRSYKSEHNNNRTAFNKALKHESKNLRACVRAYCDKCKKNPDIFEEEEVEIIDEVSDPWNWD